MVDSTGNALFSTLRVLASSFYAVNASAAVFDIVAGSWSMVPPCSTRPRRRACTAGASCWQAGRSLGPASHQQTPASSHPPRLPLPPREAWSWGTSSTR